MILLTMTGHPGLNVKPVREVLYLHCGGISSMHMHMYSQAIDNIDYVVYIIYGQLQAQRYTILYSTYIIHVLHTKLTSFTGRDISASLCDIQGHCKL